MTRLPMHPPRAMVRLHGRMVGRGRGEGMSGYENYDATSRHYDHTRVPVGVEIILGCLARVGPLDGLAVLDAGCGTGAYTAAIHERVARIDALDLSAGMLARARAKFGAEVEAGRVAFHRGAITDLPFEDRRFDGVMINQVLHHLDDDGDAGWSLHRRVFAECARVLRPGGVLVVNSCSRAQIGEGHWYYRLIPGAARRMAARFAPLDAIEALFGGLGLAPRGRFVPVDAVCQGRAYFDGRGPLDPAWRDGDSVWALADPDELAAALDRVRALDAAGEIDAFVADADARRAEIGQITFLAARREEKLD